MRLREREIEGETRTKEAGLAERSARRLAMKGGRIDGGLRLSNAARIEGGKGRDGTNRRAALPPLLCSSLKQRHDVAVEGLHGGRELEERCFAYHLIINCRVYLGADRSTSYEEGNYYRHKGAHRRTPPVTETTDRCGCLRGDAVEKETCSFPLTLEQQQERRQYIYFLCMVYEKPSYSIRGILCLDEELSFSLSRRNIVFAA